MKFTPLRHTLSVALLAVTAFLVQPASGQTDYVSQANALYKDITPARYGHVILLNALAGLESPPATVSDPFRASLLTPEASSWAPAEAWAQRPTQRAVIEAMLQITEVEDYRDAMAFAQPYGTQGIPVDMIRAGLYTELGDPPLLAAAKHGYMPRLDQMRSLLHVEATRLVFEGRAGDAADLMLRATFFGRQMIDREFIVESYWGYRLTLECLARVRDVIYLDFERDRAVDPVKLREVIRRLDPEGGLALDRLQFPRADRLAAQQVIDYVYEPRGGIKDTAFLQTMGRLSAQSRPLRRFSASAVWGERASTQVDWFDINDALPRVYDGWEQRFRLAWDSPVLSLPFPYFEYANLSKYAAITIPLTLRRPEGGFLPGGVLFDLRKTIEVERVGTRQALAVVGTFYERGLFPPQLASTRPRWVSVIEPDAFRVLTAVSGGSSRDFRFFVPVRDDYVADRRAVAKPHFMEVYPGDGTNFGVELREDEFVLYSAGANGRDDNGVRVSNDAESEIGDYLMWPPVLGLYRQHLKENGLLD